MAATTLIGHSPQWGAVVGRLPALAKRVRPVLILGETGTGKEMVARELHNLSGKRGPFIAINCGAIPGELFESELFGYEKGAFSGAARRKLGPFETAGTLLLDEIGDIPLAMQVKLLRVLQERQVSRLGSDDAHPVTARILAATHRDLWAMVQAGTFREDLYWRLAASPLHLPALRDRGDDVLAFAEAFAATDPDIKGEATTVDITGAADVLRGHTWPGNVRELQCVVSAALDLGQGVIDRESISKALTAMRPTATVDPRDVELSELRQRVADLERAAKTAPAPVASDGWREPEAPTVERWVTIRQLAALTGCKRSALRMAANRRRWRGHDLTVRKVPGLDTRGRHQEVVEVEISRLPLR